MKMAQSPAGETVVVICDPFMRRVHKMIPQSGDLLFLDATSNLDRSDSKLFHFMTPSSIGGLPVATMITTREDEDTVTFGIELLKTILPLGAFYGRGSARGPMLGATDDSEVIRNALRRAWPEIVLLLCQFHLLQAHWNWLWTSKNGIEHHEKAILIHMFKNLVYSKTDEEFDSYENKMRENQVFQKYINYQKYVDNLLERKDEWSLLFRINKKLPTSNQNTTNICETSFRREKEEVFNRHRAYNLTDMVRMVVDSSEGYAIRCVDAANGTLNQRLKNQKTHYLIKKTKIDPSEIKQIDEFTYEVPSETKSDVTYQVNLSLRLCTKMFYRIHISS